MYDAGHTKPIFGFIIVDRMSADHYRTGFGYFLLSAAENRQQNFCRQFTNWKSDDIHRSDWFTAHGIDIAQTVGCGNLAKQKGLIDDGRKKVQRLNQRCFLIKQIYPGIIGSINPDQQSRVMNLRQFRQYVG